MPCQMLSLSSSKTDQYVAIAVVSHPGSGSAPSVDVALLVGAPEEPAGLVVLEMARGCFPDQRFQDADGLGERLQLDQGLSVLAPHREVRRAGCDGGGGIATHQLELACGPQQHKIVLGALGGVGRGPARHVSLEPLHQRCPERDVVSRLLGPGLVRRCPVLDVRGGVLEQHGERLLIPDERLSSGTEIPGRCGVGWRQQPRQAPPEIGRLGRGPRVDSCGRAELTPDPDELDGNVAEHRNHRRSSQQDVPDRPPELHRLRRAGRDDDERHRAALDLRRRAAGRRRDQRPVEPERSQRRQHPLLDERAILVPGQDVAAGIENPSTGGETVTLWSPAGGRAGLHSAS